MEGLWIGVLSGAVVLEKGEDTCTGVDKNWSKEQGSDCIPCAKPPDGLSNGPLAEPSIRPPSSPESSLTPVVVEVVVAAVVAAAAATAADASRSAATPAAAPAAAASMWFAALPVAFAGTGLVCW